MVFLLCGFFAEVAQTGTARAWKARGASAPQEFKSPPRRTSLYFFESNT